MPLKNESRICIGISGLLSSGKTTSGKILEDLGFCYGRYSMVVDECLKKEGSPVSRTTQQKMGEYINKEKGQRWIGAELLKLFPDKNNLVIDGLRFPEDHHFLNEKFGNQFFHIFISCDEKMREQRYYLKAINDKSFEEANSHNVESMIGALKGLSNMVVINDLDIESLAAELKKIVSSLSQKL